jgi:hypothetical protein
MMARAGSPPLPTNGNDWDNTMRQENQLTIVDHFKECFAIAPLSLTRIDRLTGGWHVVCVSS